MPSERSRLTNPEVRFIVGAASNLAERFAGDVEPNPQQEPALAVKRLERWKRLAANGDEVVFRQILDTMEIGDTSDETLLCRLGEVRLHHEVDLLPWAELLREIVPAISAAFVAGIDCHHTASAAAFRSVPFVDLYLPIVALARQKIEAVAPGRAGGMRPEAWQGLEQHLLERLSAICSLALQPKFLAYRAVRQSGLVSMPLGEKSLGQRGKANTTLFQAFVNAQGDEGLRGFFLQFPVAARLVAQVSLFWIDFVVEFLSRLDADTAEISARYLAGQPLGKVKSIKAGISDPHRDGRSVLVVDFENGLRLVYKPRPMQIDAAFSDVLKWLNARGQQPPLHSLNVLVREGYGWENFADYSPSPNRREARRFYQRAGALLFLVDALRGIDIHRENLIASSHGPVIVDLEALCHPPYPENIVLESPAGDQWLLDSSVFRVGMLPTQGSRPDAKRFTDLSALGGPVRQRSLAPGVCWKKLNSDEMEAMMRSHTRICQTHRPRLRGKLLSMRAYLDDIVTGFKRTSRLLRSDPETTEEWRVMAAKMHGMETRVVKRMTMIYLTIISYSLDPRLLISGVDRSIELQGLPLEWGDGAGRVAEISALESLDVPAFLKVPTTGTETKNQPPTGETDLRSQVAAIRASVAKRKLLVRKLARRREASLEKECR